MFQKQVVGGMTWISCGRMNFMVSPGADALLEYHSSAGQQVGRAWLPQSVASRATWMWRLFPRVVQFILFECDF